MRLFVFQLNNFSHDFKNFVVKQDKKSEDFMAVHSALLRIMPSKKFECSVSYNWQSGFPLFIFEDETDVYVVSDTQLKMFGIKSSFEINVEV
ncbi:MAG: hypothetical protein RI943_836 [Bacteroidota bacterium]|jgi:hypothetical protein